MESSRHHTLPDDLTRTSNEMLREGNVGDVTAAEHRAHSLGSLTRGRGLEALSNMASGFKALRHIVLAVDGSMGAAAAVQWVAQQFYRPGDAVHVVHSVLCLLPKLEIYHSGPGNAYRFDAPEEHRERREVLAAQHFIKEIFVPIFEEFNVRYDVDLFVDTENAPPSALGATIVRVAADVGASLIVTTASCYESRGEQQFSTVAQYLAASSGIPIMFVRPPNSTAELLEMGVSSPAVDEVLAELSEAPGAHLKIV